MPTGSLGGPGSPSGGTGELAARRDAERRPARHEELQAAAPREQRAHWRARLDRCSKLSRTSRSPRSSRSGQGSRSSGLAGPAPARASAARSSAGTSSGSAIGASVDEERRRSGSRRSARRRAWSTEPGLTRSAGPGRGSAAARRAAQELPPSASSRARSAASAGREGWSAGSRASAARGSRHSRPSITSCVQPLGRVRSLSRCSPRSRSATPRGSVVADQLARRLRDENLAAVRRPRRSAPPGGRRARRSPSARPARPVDAHPHPQREPSGQPCARAALRRGCRGRRVARSGNTTKNASPWVSTSTPPTSANARRRSRRCASSASP